MGKTFGEILYLFDNAIPCGMRKTKPNSQGGYTLVNPPPETVFEVSSHHQLFLAFSPQFLMIPSLLKMYIRYQRLVYSTLEVKGDYFVLHFV